MTRPRAPTMNANMGSEMAVLQGSPTYKQRRRRTSISQHMSMVGNPQNPGNAQFGHRPRASSVAENGLRNTLLNQGFQRHTTPLRDSPYQRTMTPAPSQVQPIFHAHEELAKLQMEHDERYSTASPMPMDMRNSSVTPGPGDGSPAKTFTCPVPTCGRLFKRLEHLKRHVRTHTQERPYVCGICTKKFSRSDNLAQYILSYLD
jgi:transcription factor STE12